MFKERNPSSKGNPAENLPQRILARKILARTLAVFFHLLEAVLQGGARPWLNPVCITILWMESNVLFPRVCVAKLARIALRQRDPHQETPGSLLRLPNSCDGTWEMGGSGPVCRWACAPSAKPLSVGNPFERKGHDQGFIAI